MYVFIMHVYCIQSFFFVIGSTQQAQYKTRCAESWLHYASDVADDRGFLLFVNPLLYSHFSEIQ